MKNPVGNFMHSLMHDRRHLAFAIFRRLSWLFPHDELYTKIYYRLDVNKKLNLSNPELFNEKLQWLKLYDHNIGYSDMADKYLVKSIVAARIGSEYVAPVLGVWNDPRKIDWDILPEKFVLKTNHDGGGNGIVVCKDKSKLKISQAKKILMRSWRRSSYRIAREWPYKNIKKVVFAEKFLEDSRYHELRDYKFFCFDGTPKLLYVASERGRQAKANFDFFDMDFNHLEITNGHSLSKQPIEKPESFDEMKRLASELSAGFPFIRVDFYEVDGHPYFGEYTFYHLGGTGTFHPDEWNKILGDWITLPSIIK